jgi:hypothetical protein
MSFICRFCKRTFSTRSGLSQHVKYCMLNQSTSSEESSLISEINDMSLGSEGFLPNIEEVRN